MQPAPRRLKTPVPQSRCLAAWLRCWFYCGSICSSLSFFGYSVRVLSPTSGHDSTSPSSASVNLIHHSGIPICGDTAVIARKNFRFPEPRDTHLSILFKGKGVYRYLWCEVVSRAFRVLYDSPSEFCHVVHDSPSRHIKPFPNFWLLCAVLYKTFVLPAVLLKRNQRAVDLRWIIVILVLSQDCNILRGF